ncbi:MAG TPA: type II toxin-antitoxin system HicA family toxin [Ktedonobacterales bacterium]|nr:type II toxin-antitoxin system HicA family toxin [Ktedonobacterales bacterium]
MPRKKRDIRREYRDLGFQERQGKGDHRVYAHPLLREDYVVAGADGKDARDYDEGNLRKAKRALAQAQQQQKGQNKP